MSFKLVKKVIHTDRVDGTHKLVLIILADYVNEAKATHHGPRCPPSHNKQDYPHVTPGESSANSNSRVC